MTQEDWNFPQARYLSYVLAPVAAKGTPLFVVMNAGPEEVEFVFPAFLEWEDWSEILNTASVDKPEANLWHRVGERHKAASRSLSVFAGSA